MEGTTEARGSSWYESAASPSSQPSQPEPNAVHQQSQESQADYFKGSSAASQYFTQAAMQSAYGGMSHARMAESQMMGRTPFYSPLHSMAWGAAFGAAASAASPATSKSGYPGFGYPPTPPKESPGGVDPSTPSPMPANLATHQNGYGGEEEAHSQHHHGEDLLGSDRQPIDMKPSTDHLMQSMAIGYPGPRTKMDGGSSAGSQSSYDYYGGGGGGGSTASP